MADLFYMPFLPVPTQRGLPAGAARLYFYVSGTTTLAPIYADAALTTPLENPVPADALGRLPDIYLDSTKVYRVRALTANGSQVGSDVDPYYPGQAVTIVPNLPQLLAPDGSGRVGYRFTSTPADGSTQAKLSETISVKEAPFSAKGDGTTNDTAAINAANLQAAMFGKTLIIPSGTYMVDAELRATTDWRGEPGTVIKYRGSAPAFTRLVYSSGVDGITFEGITFDGNVSADPTVWNTSNYDAFTGSSGLSVEACKRPRIIRCRFVNTRQHGLRVAGCTGAVIQGCTSQRARGAFGDGFYLVSNIGLSIAQCWADDYTRIGFVVDSFGDNLLTNHKVSLTSLLCTNGHDASIMYGGGEFNAGVWCEHTGDVEASGIFAANNTHRGINICTGSKTNGFPGTHAMVTLSNCQTVGGSWGIYTYSLGTLPMVMIAKGCTAKGARVAFEADAAHGNDSFSWIGCHADYDASNGTGRGFATEPVGTLTGLPNFVVADCTISRFAESMSNLNDTGDLAATSDVGCYGAPGALPLSPFRLSVRDLKHVDDKPVYIRTYGALPHKVDIEDCDFNMRRGGGTGGTLDVAGGVIRSLIANAGGFVGDVNLSPKRVRGRITAFGTNVVFACDDVVMSDESNIALQSNAGDKRNAVRVRGDFSKNINSFGEVLSIGAGTQGFSATVDGQFFNDGVNSPATPFVRRGNSVTIIYGLALADATVTNMTDNLSSSAPELTPAGVRRVTLH